MNDERIAFKCTFFSFTNLHTLRFVNHLSGLLISGSFSVTGRA